MPRTFLRLSVLPFALLTGLAGAQQATTTPQQQPPTERIEPGSDVPTTNIPPRRGTQINEKRSNDGTVTEIEVQSGKSRYIMRPNNPAGNAQAGDAQSSAFRAPQWQVLEFDIGAKKQAAADEASTAPAAAAGSRGTAGAAAAGAPATGKPAGTVPPATVPMTAPADVPPPPPLPTNQR